MKVKIEFFTKCLYCLYETPNSKTMTWENNVKVDSDEEIEFSEENIAIMLDQLHAYNSIVCENCGHSDKLAFAIQKVNDKPFLDSDIDNNSEEFIDESDSRNEFDIHSDILRYAKTGYILFIMKDGSAKIGKVDGIVTSHSNGEKRYTTKIYHDIRNIENEEFDFDIEDGYFYNDIYLKDIRDVENFSY